MQVLLNDIDVTLKDLSANRGTLDFDTEISIQRFAIVLLLLIYASTRNCSKHIES
jgi:hypothetical protein|nr:MAG TPA: hypothetical protein [Myoviridae sp. ctTS62]